MNTAVLGAPTVPLFAKQPDLQSPKAPRRKKAVGDLDALVHQNQIDANLSSARAQVGLIELVGVLAANSGTSLDDTDTGRLALGLSVVAAAVVALLDDVDTHSNALLRCAQNATAGHRE